MKTFITPILNFAIDKAKRNRFIQNVFESPFDLSKFPEMGVFTDSFGNDHSLKDGLRSKIRPGWQRMLTTEKTVVNNEYLVNLKSHGSIAVNKLKPVVESYNKSFINSNILEVGCNTGAASYYLAEAGASHVTGTEFAGYKVDAVESNGKRKSNLLKEVNDELKGIRDQLSGHFQHSERVTFADDDICNSKLKPESFDIICSWEVLEHIHDPEKAFASMFRLLKTGGIMIHEYNPFFCLNGGHSLCTLDFLWGHVRLNNQDFMKYVETVRPAEKERAYSFFTNGLNRMTLFDLDRGITKAGFERVSTLPFTKEQHVRMVNHEVLAQSRHLYPQLTMLDLTAPRVIIAALKS